MSRNFSLIKKKSESFLCDEALARFYVGKSNLSDQKAIYFIFDEISHEHALKNVPKIYHKTMKHLLPA